MRAEDFIGSRFGRLTVIADSGRRRGHSVIWRCACDCGGEIEALRHELSSGNVASCGCVAGKTRRRVSDLVGRRFGKLVVSEDTGARRGGCILWRCKCDCGGEIDAVRRELSSGNVANCGCEPKAHAPKRGAEDLTGRRFGELTVISRAENSSAGRIRWLCRCSCGNMHVVEAMRLKSGHTASCGCARRKSPATKRDLTGMRFGRLTVLHESLEKEDSGQTIWHCRCSCGREVDVHIGNLLQGFTKSCGCLNSEQASHMHAHMHYQDGTCLEILKRIPKMEGTNKTGHRGLFLTKSGTYRATIAFQGKRYYLGTYKDFEDAVCAREDAEELLQRGYLEAHEAYEAKALRDPAWAAANPFFYNATQSGGKFEVGTNGFG